MCQIDMSDAAWMMLHCNFLRDRIAQAADSFLAYIDGWKSTTAAEYAQ